MTNEEEFKQYLERAEKGDAAAQESLARLCWRCGCDYENGEGVKKDYSKAVVWYKKAIDAYSAGLLKTKDAKHWVAGSVAGYFSAFDEWNKETTAMKEKGNLEGAVKEYSAAAEAGSGEALLELARCYDCGEGVEEDTAQAVSLYEKALELLECNKQTARLLKLSRDKVYKKIFYSTQMVYINSSKKCAKHILKNNLSYLKKQKKS